MRLGLLLLMAGALDAQGWETLFDGVSTRGWMEVTGARFPGSWTIEDGCLKTLPSPEGMHDLRTVGTYRTYELRFEWKLEAGGNSGVKYRIQKTDRWRRKGESGYQARARGAEYQLLADPKAPPNQQTAALYTVHAPTPVKPTAPDVFHESRIVVAADHVEHWLDGEKVLTYPLAEPPAETYVSLQNHDSKVWFRNLKIRRF